MKDIKVLDCTLRDGGFALEDAIKNDIPTEVFTEKERTVIADHLVNSNAEVIELGAIEVSKESKKGFGIYKTIEEISGVIANDRRNGQIFAAFYRGPDIDIKQVPEWKPGMIDAPRVCIRYSEIKKSLDFCEGLSKRGYKVFIQPMVTARYTEDEIDLLIDRANEMKAYALYFVDSYGYLTAADVKWFFDKYNNKLDPSIRIGFHAHNNMEMAFPNVVSFINVSKDRPILIDACAMGMGQGTGNLQTEVIMNYLNSEYGKKYSMEHIYKVCEIVNRFNTGQLWGYHPIRFMSAANKTAYKYAMALMNKYGFEWDEIQNILSRMPDDLRFRYTPDNTEELLRRIGKDSL